MCVGCVDVCVCHGDMTSSLLWLCGCVWVLVSWELTSALKSLSYEEESVFSDSDSVYQHLHCLGVGTDI